MNQMVSTADIERDVVAAIPTMTRTEKLTRWAHLIRKQDPRQPFLLYHGLERMPPLMLEGMLIDPRTAFALAVNDPILRDAGLVGGTVAPGQTTMGEVMRFFELSRDELHEFSCDCGGAILSEDMANRIEKIAKGHGGGPLGYVRNLFR